MNPKQTEISKMTDEELLTELWDIAISSDISFGEFVVTKLGAIKQEILSRMNIMRS